MSLITSNDHICSLGLTVTVTLIGRWATAWANDIFSFSSTRWLLPDFEGTTFSGTRQEYQPTGLSLSTWSGTPMKIIVLISWCFFYINVLLLLLWSIVSVIPPSPKLCLDSLWSIRRLSGSWSLSFSSSLFLSLISFLLHRIINKAFVILYYHCCIFQLFCVI